MNSSIFCLFTAAKDCLCEENFEKGQTDLMAVCHGGNRN